MRNVLVISMLLICSATLFAADKKVYSVDPAKCVGCQLCVPVCPTKAITMKNNKAVVDPEKCIGCSLCAQKCPTKAFSEKMIKQDDKKKSEKLTEPVTAEENDEFAVKPAKPLQPQEKPEQSLNAAKEAKKVFEITKKECTGCRECVPACPVKAIHMISGKAVIDPEKCIACGVCQRVCAFAAPHEKEVNK